MVQQLLIFYYFLYYRMLVTVKSEWWDAGMVVCLGQGADLHMAHLMPLPLTISCCSKFRLVLPSWFYVSGAGSPG